MNELERRVRKSEDLLKILNRRFSAVEAGRANITQNWQSVNTGGFFEEPDSVSTECCSGIEMPFTLYVKQTESGIGFGTFYWIAVWTPGETTYYPNSGGGAWVGTSNLANTSHNHIHKFYCGKVPGPGNSWGWKRDAPAGTTYARNGQSVDPGSTCSPFLQKWSQGLTTINIKMVPWI